MENFLHTILLKLRVALSLRPHNYAAPLNNLIFVSPLSFMEVAGFWRDLSQNETSTQQMGTHKYNSKKRREKWPKKKWSEKIQERPSNEIGNEIAWVECLSKAESDTTKNDRTISSEGSRKDTNPINRSILPLWFAVAANWRPVMIRKVAWIVKLLLRQKATWRPKGLSGELKRYKRH